MGTQQFFKGLLMSILTVIIAAFSTQPIDYLLLTVTAASVVLVYVGKNLIDVLHSDSPAGSLSLINLASGVLIALGTGILQAFGTYVVEGVIIWAMVWKVAVSATLTYLGATFFAPRYTTVRARVFVSPSTVAMLKRTAWTVVLLIGMTAVASAQSSLTKGFLKPVTQQTIMQENLTSGNTTFDMSSITTKLRLDASVIGTASYLKEGGGLHNEAFSKMAIGLTVTQFDAEAYKRWAAGLMLTLPTNIDDGKYGVSLVGGYSIFTLGANYDFGSGTFKERFCILTGLSLDLFNMVR